MERKFCMLTQSEIKYNRLMERAEDLFSKYGYKAVSMDEIADAAGISKMTIYKYFPSKEDLFFKVLQDIVDKSYNHIEARLKTIDGTIEKIDELLNYGIETTRHFSLAFYKDVMENSILADKIIEEKKRRGKEIFLAIIRDGKNRGEVRDVDEIFVAKLLMALIDGVTNSFFDNIHDMKDIEYFTENLYDFIKYGLICK